MNRALRIRHLAWFNTRHITPNPAPEYPTAEAIVRVGSEKVKH